MLFQYQRQQWTKTYLLKLNRYQAVYVCVVQTPFETSAKLFLKRQQLHLIQDDNHDKRVQHYIGDIISLYYLIKLLSPQRTSHRSGGLSLTVTQLTASFETATIGEAVIG